MPVTNAFDADKVAEGTPVCEPDEEIEGELEVKFEAMGLLDTPAERDNVKVVREVGDLLGPPDCV